MKRLAIVISAALLMCFPARADTLAEQVATEAKRLLAQVSAAQNAASARPAAKAQSVSASLAADLQRFGLAASRLSTEINQRGGPTDLRCIFRGMADETSKQLAVATSAKSSADRAKAYARLTHMLKDAVEIAPAVGGKATAASSVRAAAAQCPAVDF